MNAELMSGIEAFLFDLDGVFYVGDRLIDGAAETITTLRERGVPMRFCTNTTVLSNASLLAKLKRLGLPIESSEVFGAIRAAQDLLRRHGCPRIHLLARDDPRQDFAEFPQDSVRPDFVVIGDQAKEWDWRMMQEVFEMVVAGAEIVALHKGRYWQTADGLRVDFGAVVAGLEYVTGKTATIVGKPSASFFKLLLEDLGLPADRVAMVGDDINSDVGGAQAIGMKGILVRTGKYREELVAASDVTPDSIVDSVAALIQ